MKEGWKEICLNDISKTQYGYTASATLDNTGVKFLRITDIVPDFIDWDYVPFCEISQKDRDKYLLKKGDIVVARTGATVGYAKIINQDNIDSVFASYLVKIDLDETVDKIYIGKIIESKIYKDYIQTIAGGSAQPNANANDLTSFKIEIPVLKVQQRIASILYTYDDLIEVNNKRIELLEQSARELYKEWFVRMRFPNYQNTKFNKGIPEGWEAKKIGEIVDRKKFGKTYKEAELEKIGNVIVIDQSAHPFLGFHNNKADHLATEENPIILFGDHSCKMEIMIKPFSLAENVIPFKALDNDMSIYYLYHLVNNLVVTTEYKRHWGELTSKLVLIPNNKDISNLFHEFCKSIYSQINYLKEYNLQLTEIRNRLLPRLISGKLEVKA